jgi:hypothetical protein|eukprot:COSAG06_NODE_12319_length_1395_cov_15.682870_2_plen_196_part_00
MSAVILIPLMATGAAAAAASSGASAAVWASHPVASNQTLMLQIYGASASAKVTLEEWSESTKSWTSSSASTLSPESASSSGLAVALPTAAAGGADDATQEHSAYRVAVDGGEPMHVNIPEVWWALGDAGTSATNGGKGWVRLFGRSIALGDGPSRLKLTHSEDGKATLIPMEQNFSHTGSYCARFRIPADLAPGD